ncbi:MAG: tRNA and rRNA cytosine-C5-methylase, partial [Oscillospiraceae bacterium]|nr:tRNA and rRNA cytosine-C5-methylase [Oscillospiraceae bacterium]
MELDYFTQRERALLGQRYEELYRPLQEAAFRGITVNTLRAEPRTVAENSGLKLEPSPFCENGFLLKGEDLRPGNHPYHKAGVFYVQEPSASAPADLLEVRPGHKVLDLCAAPGGKSSQLAAALGGEGLLVSSEYDSG